MWVLLSVLTAFFESLKDVFSKIGLKKGDEYIFAWFLNFFSLLMFLLLLPFITISKPGDRFWLALVIGGILNMITNILYMKALKSSDLSITVPMVTFTPVFLLLTSPIMVGEFPDIFGVMGILAIVTGSYLLNIREKTRGFFPPFKALFREKGPAYMLLVAFLWSITANFDKIGIRNSSVFQWIISIHLFSTILMLPLVIIKSGTKIKALPSQFKSLVPVGFFAAVRTVCQMLAINLALVPYVISIKRTSVIFTILFGYIIFKEKGIKERLAGSLLMIAGVLMITL